jgi:hypothetical protein
VIAPLLTPERAAALLDDTVYHQVRELVDMCCIFSLEHRLARELAARGARGREMLAPARALISQAFRRLADECDAGWRSGEEDELRDAYLEAIGDDDPPKT